MPESRAPLRKSLIPLGTSVFSEMTRLAVQHGAINLAQGFPDFDGPESVRRAAARTVVEGPSQYARSMGLPDLTRSIGKKFKRHYGLDFDPEREICVFSGATEALFCAILSLTEPGDEVLLIEPTYDSYVAACAMAGVVPRFSTLIWPDFRLDVEDLEKLVSPRTRLLVFNSPHNPTGRVFDAQELSALADFCQRHDLLAVTDEVYEHLVYPPHRHIPLATLGKMADRTVTISSLGKTFSLTGWKIGWACGPAELIAALHSAHQFVTFCTATPLQAAAVAALEIDEAYFLEVQEEFRARRDFLLDCLTRSGFRVQPSQGTYFVMADFSPLTSLDDVSFARFLTREVGVACIPPSVFYQRDPAQANSLARFAFCKRMDTLQAAALRLQSLARKL